MCAVFTDLRSAKQHTEYFIHPEEYAAYFLIIPKLFNSHFCMSVLSVCVLPLVEMLYIMKPENGYLDCL